MRLFVDIRISDIPKRTNLGGTVATFTDANSGTIPDDYTALIDWNDANNTTTPGIITANGAVSFKNHQTAQSKHSK